MASPAAAAIHLSRRDIKSTSSAAHGGLLVYPYSSKKAKQRVAVGDRTGAVSVFSIGKRLDEVPVFNTVESDMAISGGGGGSAQSPSKKQPLSCATLFTDQLFCVRGSVVDAYSRKGKHFFSVDTNATERIHSVAVHTPFFFISGEYMVTAFKESKELSLFMAPDRVREMVAFPVKSALAKADLLLTDYMVCLGCNDRTIRVVRGKEMVEELACEAAVTALFFDETQRRLYYGTEIGSIGVFDVVGDQTLRRRCSYLPNSGGSGGMAAAASSSSPAATSAAVTCLALFDVNMDDRPEVLAGFDDGTVQVFAVIESSSASPSLPTSPPTTNSVGGTSELQSVWSGGVGEKVVSIAGGCVTLGPAQPDVLVHCFSGQLSAFTLDLADANAHSLEAVEAAEAARRQREQQEAVAAKRADTAADIDRLQGAIAVAAGHLARETGAAARRAPLVAVASTFTATVGLRAVDQTAMMALVVDADVPLECAILRSTAADVTFFGTDSTQVTMQAHHSYSPQQGGGGQGSSSPSSPRGSNSNSNGTSGISGSGTATKSLALALPLQQQHNNSGGGGSKRLEALLWADDEGHADVISVTLYATQAPRTAQVKSVLLCALPLYHRIGSLGSHFDSSIEMQLGLSRVTVAGAFTARQAAEWLSRLLADLSEAPSAATQRLLEESVSRPLCFYSAFLGTVFSVEFTAGDYTGTGAVAGGASSDSVLTLSSDSPSALLTARRHLVRNASAVGVSVRTRDAVLFGSAVRRLARLAPLMERCAAATREAELLGGLRELQGADTDLTFLPAGHQRLLQSAEAVAAEAARQAQQLAFLRRAVVALYDSLVQFRAHVPPLATAAAREVLEAAACGAGYSAAGLGRLFFPRGEDVAERDAILAEAARRQEQQQPQLAAGSAGLGNSSSTPELSGVSDLSDGE